MRKTLLAFLFCLVASTAVTNNLSAQGTVLYYWNFNNFTTTYNLPAYASVAADTAAPGKDTAKARWVNKPISSAVSASYPSYSDPVTGDVTNARFGAIAGNGFRARNPNDSMNILIYLPTQHYTNLTLKYACELSSYTSGDSINVFSYSTDSGTTWISSGAGLSEWVDSGSLVYSLIHVHFNDISASNNSKLVFRINLVGRNTGGSGNNRFDNVTLEGDSINLSLGVNPLTAAAVTYTMYPNPASDVININGGTEGDKTVIICNAAGQIVSTEPKSGKNFSVNTSKLAAGVYNVSIRDNASGLVNTLKFTKD